MKPIIRIRYSRLLDRQCRELSDSLWKKQYERILGDSSYPSAEEIKKKIPKYEREWKKVEDIILKELSGVLNLKFSELEIPVYIVGFGRAHSDPLVIPSNFEGEEFVNVLIHELVHRILTYNDKGANEDYISPKIYPNEKEIVAIHIVVHAILKYIYLDVLNDNSKLVSDIERVNSDYKRSWDIVETEGYKEIIEKFLNEIG